MRNKRTPALGDIVEFVANGVLVSAVLVDTWDSPLSGRRRARVADSWSDRDDPDAGKDLYFDQLRLPPGVFH